MKPLKLGYLGPAGTFSEEAALLYHRSHQQSFALLEQPTVAQVVEKVASGKLDQGLSPGKFTGGSVAATADQLVWSEGIYIYSELVTGPAVSSGCPGYGAGTDHLRLFSFPRFGAVPSYLDTV